MMSTQLVMATGVKGAKHELSELALEARGLASYVVERDGGRSGYLVICRKILI
jgi:hypothetical protein